MRTGILALAFTLSVWSSCSAPAAPLEVYTHTAAAPEQSLKLAATWFLPDWQAKSSARSDSAPSGSGDRRDLTCSTYGACIGIPANTTCTEKFSASGTACYKSCSCKSGYHRVNGSDICQGCFNPCDRVTDIAAPYGCQTAWAECPSKCQVAYTDNCRNRSAVPTPYGCQSYFNDCPSKCQTAYPNNCRNRTAVATPYGCQSYFSDCSAKCAAAKPCPVNDCSAYTLTSAPANSRYLSCSPGCGNNTEKYRVVGCETGYLLKNGQCLSDNCPAGSQKTSCDTNQIYEGFAYTEYGSGCYRCRQKNCSDYGTNFYTSVPSGKSCSRVVKGTVYCYTNCCDDSCPTGYQKTDCNPANGNFVGMPEQNQDVKTNACGNKCYLCKNSSSCTSKCTSTTIPNGAATYTKECNKYYCAKSCKSGYFLTNIGTCLRSINSGGSCSCPSGTYANRPSCSKPSTVKGYGNCCCYRCDGLGRVNCLTSGNSFL